MTKIGASMSNLGIANNVSLTTEENSKLIQRFGVEMAKDWIEKLSLWKAASRKSKSVKSDYYTILNWARKDGTIEAHTPKPAPLITAAEQHDRAVCLMHVTEREGDPKTLEACIAAIQELDKDRRGFY
jgi:hypothetical protein